MVGEIGRESESVFRFRLFTDAQWSLIESDAAEADGLAGAEALGRQNDGQGRHLPISVRDRVA